MKLLLPLLISVLSLALGSPVRTPFIINADFEETVTTCGYASCPVAKPGFLNVHLVPHTHDDVGWLKTVDQYYYGSRSSTQKAGVQYILDSVVSQLLQDRSKRFVYVETAFFWKWWKEQHDTVRYQVKKLVKNGQLEFIGGGWSMNDEATTHYQSIIDQFTWGLRKLNETFGECGRPKVGWQIDPFGHSREQASIFAQLGFDGMLFGRLDYQDKVHRLESKTAEMVWQGSANLGNSSQLFTSVLFNTYSPPPGFCFDVLCDDEPIIDSKKSPDYNVDKRVTDFLNYAQMQAKHYTSENIIITMGNDFTYQDAGMWYKNMDKLIKYANALQSNGSKINLFYSTPSCYLKSVYEEDKNKKWPVKTDDFFPYASDPHSYWTGYFTSRPALKRFERLGNNFLQVCKQLYAIVDLGPEDWVDLNALREAMGVMQHHDAVSGTEQQHVAEDYARQLTRGIDECEIIATTALNKMMAKGIDAPKVSLESCLLLNISQCATTEKEKDFVVTLYNPLSRSVSHYVKVPVTGKAYTVVDPDGNDLTVQLTPISDAVQKIPGRVSQAVSDLSFYAADLPPLGYKSYYVQRRNADDITLKEDKSHSRHHIGNENIKLVFDKKTSMLSHVKFDNTQMDITHNFLWYKSAVGDNREFKNRSSGAYIFRPDGNDAMPVAENVVNKVFKGPLYAEIQQTYNSWVSNIIRYYNQEKYIESEWQVGPIPINDGAGKEIVSRFSAKLKTNGQFYTDSNGREMLQRNLNSRPTWKLNLLEEVAGNYYPVTSKISVHDEAQGIEFAILNDRAQGGTSLKDGEIELMVHRRILHDDAFGVEEALNETAFGTGLVGRGQHYIKLGFYKNSTPISFLAEERDLAQRKLLAAWTYVSPTNGLSYQDYKMKYNMQFAGLKNSLPQNVQILTLEPWKAMSFLLRLEHVFEKNEDPELSKPVNVNVKNMFTTFTLKSIHETTLGANQWLEDNKRFDWKTEESFVSKLRRYKKEQTQGMTNTEWRENHMNYLHESDGEVFEYEQEFDETLSELYEYDITLNPMQIRTFVIEIEKN